MEKIILKKIGDRWREHKSDLKALYFDANKSMEANNTNVPKGVIKDQWITLVSNWMTPKAQVYILSPDLLCTCSSVMVQNSEKYLCIHYTIV